MKSQPAALAQPPTGRIDRLVTLTRLNQFISSSLDMGEVLREIAQAAAILMQAPVVGFWIVDEDARTLQVRSLSDAGIGVDFPLPHLDFDHGGVGWVATHRRTLNVPDVTADARFVALDWWRQHGVQSFVGVPVMFDDHLLAVLVLAGRQPFHFEPDEQYLLESFVAQAAVAIRNARLFQESRDQATRLAEINAALQSEIAARQEIESALRFAKEAAEEARVAAVAANHAKSAFLATMSHELRTPLNSVIGFSNILLKQAGTHMRQREVIYIERVRDNGVHLLRLINDVLDLSKIETGHYTPEIAPVSLGDLIQEVLEQFESQLRERPIELCGEWPSTMLPLHTDAQKLKQILINLIGNALKFTERGTVTVRASVGPTSHLPAALEVIDTGIGIPADGLHTIFEAFQQADNSISRRYGGTGLGLAISRSLCRCLGYDLDVRSEVGVGSSFRIDLVTRAAAVNSHSKQSHRGSGTPNTGATQRLPSSTHAWEVLQGKLALVIDNELDARMLLTQYLEELGCRVVTCGSGEQGIHMARALHPDFVTLDLRMPQMNGIEVLQVFKADPKLCTIPVVVISLSANESQKSVLGVVDLLDKSAVRDDLLAVLQRLLPAKAHEAQEYGAGI